MMSKAVGSRSHEQCRSHHNKMVRSYKSVRGVIEHFQGSKLESPKKDEQEEFPIEEVNESEVP